MKVVAAGVNPVVLRQGMQKSVKYLVGKIKELAKEITSPEEILQIATVATSGNAQMGTIIAKAFEKVGETGSTTVEESQTLVDDVEFTEGLTIDRGTLSPYFINAQHSAATSFFF